MQTRFDSLRLPTDPHAAWRWRVFREWCFLRAVGRRLGFRLALLVAIWFIGAGLMMALDPRHRGEPVEAAYHVWFLILANPTEDLPAHPVLRVLFFALPLLGLMVLVESLVELALLLRDRRQAQTEWSKVMASSMRDHVVLVGLGRLGFRTFSLLRRLDRRVVVIDKNTEGQFLDAVRKDGSPLLIGDGRRDELLREAGVERAAAIILATQDDLANLEMALDARRFNPGIRVVLRMFDQTLADKVAGAVNINVAMSQSAISAPAFATAAIEPSVIASTVVDDQLVVMVRRTIDARDALAGRSIADVIAQGLGVVSHTRSGVRTLFPSLTTTLAAGDEVVLQGAYEKLDAMRGGT